MKVIHLIRIKSIVIGCFLLLTSQSYAQEFSAGINVDNPNPNAVLHLVSPNGNQGIIIPRLSSAQRTAMALGAADTGLLVYDDDASGFFFWNGTIWIVISNTDQQDLADVLTQGADAGGIVITNAGNPIAPQDVATKNYVDTQAESDPTVLASVKDGVDYTELTGVPVNIDIDATDDLALTTNPAAGDVTGNYSVGLTVATVGGSTAADINTATTTVNGATSLDLDSTDDLALTTNPAAGDVTGNYSVGLTVATVGGSTAADINTATTTVNGATSLDLDSTDDLALTTNPAAGDVTGNYSVGLTVATVGGSTAADINTATTTVNGATSLDLDSTDDLALTTNPAAGDVTGNYSVGLTVATVGGSTAADINTATTTVNGATNLDLDSTDDLALTTNPAAGDVTGNYSVGLTVATVGGSTAADINTATTTVNGATNLDIDATDDLTIADIGTAAGNVVTLSAANTLPALDGSNLTGITPTIGANTITSTELAPDAVTTAEIAPNTIIDADVAAGAAIAGTKINPNFGTQDIVARSIDIGPGVANIDNLGNGGFSNNLVVGNNFSVSGSMTGSTLDIGASNMTVNAAGDVVATSFTGDGSGLTGITPTIAANSIGTAELAPDAVTTSEIVNLTITDADVSNTANIQGIKVDPDFGAQNIITTGNVVIAGTVDGRDVATDGTNQDALQTLSGAGAGAVNYGAVFTGATIPDNSNISGALQALEIAVEGVGTPAASAVTSTAVGNVAAVNVQDAIAELDAEKLALTGGALTGAVTSTSTFDGRDVGVDGTNQDALQTLSGQAAGATDLGVFAGTTITANTDITGALQDLETAVETATDDQTAVEVNFTPAGGIAATEVQAALTEVDAEKLALTGGALTGAVTSTSTFDGRDVGVDGTNQDALQTLSGQAAGATDLGVFGGTTITANTDITGALQDLETAVETATDDQTAAEVNFTPAGGIAATEVQAALTEVDAEKLALTGGALTGAVTSTSTFDGRDVGVDGTNQDALQTLSGQAAGATDLGVFAGTTITANTDITGALQDLETAVETATDDQTAAEVNFTPAGGIAATEVQAALTEVDAEKLALTGGALTGAVTSTSTFDGRDVGVDGTNQDALQTLSGQAAGATDLGVFGGTTITANTDITGALQDLETAVETATDDQTAVEVNFTPAGGIAATEVQAALTEVDAEKLALTGGALTGAVTSTSTFDGRDVGVDGTNQDALQTLSGQAAGATDLGVFAGTTITANTDITGALQDLETAVETATDDQTAAEVNFTPAGGIAATEVQAALTEVDAEKLALTGGALTGAVTSTSTFDGRDVGVDGTNQDALQTLSGQAAGATDLGVFAGTTITANTDITGALQDLETAVETATDDQTAAEVNFTPAGGIAATEVQAALTEVDAEKLALTGGALTGAVTSTSTFDGRDVGVDGTNQDALQTLSGQAAGATDLGVFAGTTITANTDITGALQDLETAVETATDDQTAAEVNFTPAGGIAATEVQAALTEVDAEKLALTGGALTGAVTSTSTFDGRDVGVDGTNQDALQTLSGQAAGATDLGVFGGTTITANTDITGALQDLETAVESATDDQTAVEVNFTPAGGIAATEVQAALTEVDAEKLALTGGTMTGNLDMGANNITSTGTVTAGSFAGDGTSLTGVLTTGALAGPETITTGGTGEDLTIDGAGVFTSNATTTNITSNNINLGDAAGDIITVNGGILFEEGVNDLQLDVPAQTNAGAVLRIPDLPTNDETIALQSQLATALNSGNGVTVNAGNIDLGGTLASTAVITTSAGPIDLRIDGAGTLDVDAAADFSANATFSSIDVSGGTIAGLTDVTLRDNNFLLEDNVDATKDAQFELSSITPATTRTYTLPDADGTIALTSDITSLNSGSGVTVNAGNIDLGGILTAATAITTGAAESLTINGAGNFDVSANANFTGGTTSIANANISSGTISGTGIIVADNTLTLEDDADNTKDARFELGGITTGTLRTYNLPDADGEIALVGSPVTDAAVPDDITINTPDNRFTLFDDVTPANTAIFELGNLTAPQFYDLPDASGEIALVGAPTTDAAVPDDITINTPDNRFTLFDDVTPANTAIFELGNLTAPQFYDLPDASGEIALVGSPVTDAAVPDDITINTPDNRFTLFDDVTPANTAIFELGNLTAPQFYDLPDASGEIALVGAPTTDAAVPDDITINTPDNRFTLFDDVTPANTAIFELGNLTAPQFYDLPDASGEIALVGAPTTDAAVPDDITINTPDNRFTLFDDVTPANTAIFELGNLTAPQFYDLPDASGEIALVGAPTTDAAVPDDITINTPDNRFTLFDDVTPANTAIFELGNLTAPQFYDLPDASGEIALVGAPTTDAAVPDDITINTPDNRFTLFDDVTPANTATLELINLTAPQVYDLPDASGTIALTSDILASLVSEPNGNGTLVGGTGAAPAVTGVNNTVYGVGAASSLTAGTGNTIVGEGIIVSGSSNVAVGRAADVNGGGTAIGFGAVANGTNTVALGQSASSTGNNSVAIGAGTNVTAADVIVLGNGQNVGIDSNTPGSLLQVGGSLGLTPFFNDVDLAPQVIDLDVISNNLIVDYSIANQNRLERINTADSSVFIGLGDGEFKFLSVLPNPGTAPVNLNTEIRSLLELNNDGNAEFEGGVRLGDVDPGEQKDGMIRWTGSDFEGNTDGSPGGWVSLTGGGGGLVVEDLPNQNLLGGNSAGSAITTGTENTYYGTNSGVFNNTGSRNTFIGTRSGESNVGGNENVFLGTFAGASNTGGSSNVLVGVDAGEGINSTVANTTGNNITLIGHQADVAADGLNNATAIGQRAIVGSNNSLVLGGTGPDAVNVGIGTETPLVTLDVNGDVSMRNAGVLSVEGDGGTNVGGVVFYDGDNSEGVIVQAPEPLAATYDLVWPVDAGLDGQVLTRIAGTGSRAELGWTVAGGGSFVMPVFDTNPDNTFFGVTNANNLFSPAGNKQLGVVSDGSKSFMTSASFGNTPEIRLSRANGSQGAASAIVINDIIGEIAFTGYDAGNVYRVTAGIQAEAIEAYGNGDNYGTALRFNVTSQGPGSAINEVMTIRNQSVGINQPVPAGGSALDVNGETRTTTLSVASSFNVNNFGQTSITSAAAGNLVELTHNAGSGNAISVDMNASANTGIRMSNIGGDAIDIQGTTRITGAGDYQTQNGDISTLNGGIAVGSNTPRGGLDVSGSQFVGVRSIGGNFVSESVLADDYIIFFDPTAADGTLELPFADASTIGRKIVLYTRAPGTNITVVRQGANEILLGPGPPDINFVLNLGAPSEIFSLTLIQISANEWMAFDVNRNP